MLKTNKPRLTKRLRIIQGQTQALERLLEENAYCPDVIRLSLAIQKSLQSFNQAFLENHLSEHVSHQFKSGKDKQVIKELVEIYALSNK